MAKRIEDRPTTYADLEDIENVLDIPTPGSPNGETMKFTDETHPSANYVKKLILSAEDELDRRTHDSWRVNYVKDEVLDIRSFQNDENGYRQTYYLQGGNVVNLHKNVCRWNPFPIYEYHRCDEGKIILEPLKGKVKAPRHTTQNEPLSPPLPGGDDDDRPYVTGENDPLYVHERSGEIIYNDDDDPEMEYVYVYYRDKDTGRFVKTDERHYVPLRDGTLQYVLDSEGKRIEKMIQPKAPKYKKLIYGGDKMFIRRPMFYMPSLNIAAHERSDNMWVDVSENLDSNPNNSTPNAWFWFDYKSGRLFIRSYFLGTRQNALRITYRWGKTDEPVPMQISRACSLIVATQIINGSAFALKFGLGGDVAGVKDNLIRNWELEINRALASFQRAGTVHSWSR